ncbi:MAG: hypothetical protein C4583_04925 [Anaerolineaceae bacterium]|nr:MAG: hypothetical protein C4583_04925 [Anaerolineaceae bacterium]
MNKIRELWKKSTLNKVIISIVGFVCLPCLACLCIIVIIPTPPSTPAPAVAISTIIEETSTAARIQTVAAPTLAPLFTEPPSPTSVILPTLTPFPTQNISSVSVPACVPNREPQTGLVTKVVDGDTIYVRLDADGQTYSVRYIGIDTPESTIQHEPFGKEASDKNAELVSGKRVTLFKDVSETDKYDRLLRYVFTDEYFVNYELVKQGYANAATYPPDVACADYFREGESYARDLLLGLWAFQPEPTSASLPPNTTQTVIITAVNKQAEYVDIKNIGPSPVNLNGWTLVSEKGNQACSLGGILEPGATLRIWAGTNATGFSCGYNKYIWNNSEPDPAVLYDAQGHEVDRY